MVTMRTNNDDATRTDRPMMDDMNAFDAALRRLRIPNVFRPNTISDVGSIRLHVVRIASGYVEFMWRDADAATRPWRKECAPILHDVEGEYFRCYALGDRRRKYRARWFLTGSERGRLLVELGV